MLESLTTLIGPLDKEAMAETQKHLDNLTKPPGSLGVLENIALKLAGITGSSYPTIKDKAVVVMAGDHGVVAQGVTPWPQEVTCQMVYNFVNGGAAINVLTRHAGARVVVVDIGVATDITSSQVLSRKVKYGTDDMAVGPAMSREEALRAIETGREVVWEEIDQGVGLIGTGEMGIGNTTPSSAILAAFSGYPLERIVGRGTGCDDERLRLKINVIERALAVNQPDPRDAVDVLAKVGGLEIAGLTGCILGAAARRVPVVIDGFISSAAALVATRIEPRVRDYIIASHLSEEPGHEIMLNLMGLEAMLRMKMRLGEGTGAALAFNLIDASTKILREMATFSDAGVSEAS